MKTATISQTRNQLSAILDAVRHGETVVITDRNQPIARIEPISVGDGKGDDKLKRLERRGLLRRGTGKTVKKFLTAPPDLTRGLSAVAAFLADRSDARRCIGTIQRRSMWPCAYCAPTNFAPRICYNLLATDGIRKSPAQPWFCLP